MTQPPARFLRCSLPVPPVTSADALDSLLLLQITVDLCNLR